MIGDSLEIVEVESASLATLVLGLRGRSLRPSVGLGFGLGCSGCSEGEGIGLIRSASALEFTRNRKETKSGFSWSPKLMPTVTLGRIRRFCSRPRCRTAGIGPSLSLSSADRLLAVLWREEERDDIRRGLKFAISAPVLDWLMYCLGMVADVVAEV